MKKYLILFVLFGVVAPTQSYAFICDDIVTAGGGGSSDTGLQSMACGTNNGASGQFSSAIGNNNIASGNDSTAIGYNNEAVGSSSTAVGKQNTSRGTYSSTLGYYNFTSGNSSTALGNFNNAVGLTSGLNSTAVGFFNTASGDYSTAVGTQAQATVSNGIAIGNGASSTLANSIALGSGSAAAAVNTGSYTINGGSIAATSSAGGIVSIGVSGSERQIQNVAAGVVTATSTDAVNGSQLYAVGNALNNGASGSATALGATWNAATGTWTAPTYSVNGTSYSTVGDAVGAVNASADTLGTTTVSALGGGSTYTAGAGVSAPTYAVQGQNYNNVGSAFTAVDSSLSSLNNQVSENTSSINSLQGQVNNLAAGYFGHSQDIAALRQGVQRGYEGTAVALAAAGGNFLQENQKFSLTGKFGTFRGQAGIGAIAQARLNQNVIAHAGIGGGLRYGGVGAFGGMTIGW